MQNMLMQGAPQDAPEAQMEGAPQGGPPGAAPTPQGPSPEQIAQARSHLSIVLKGLMALAAKPRGSLSKRDLYNAAGEMIADGAFGSPEAKQGLIAQLAQIPDDEAAIREAVGSQILQLAHAANTMTQRFGQEAQGA